MSGSRNPALGNDDPRLMVTQARVGDAVYKMYPSDPPTIQILSFANDQLLPGSSVEPDPGMEKEIRKKLLEYRNQLIQRYKRPDRVEISAEHREQMKALGYLDN
jgi:hypothetical protein